MTKDQDKLADKPAAILPAVKSGAAAPPQVPALRPAQAAGAPGLRKRGWLWLGAGALVVAAAVLSYVQPWVAKPPLVMIEVAALAPATRVLAVNGRMAAAHSVDVRPQASGAIERLFVAEGDTVKPEQSLARINADTQNTLLRQAVAGLDAALVAQEGARAAFDRSSALGANVSRSDLEGQSRALQSAAQEVARMTAMVDQAQIALNNHTVVAPIGGKVLTLRVDPGQIVDASTVLMTLADLTDLMVETDVDEVYATQISQGQPAVLQLAGESVTRAGHVSHVSDRVDVATGGLAVKLVFDEAVSAPVGLTVTANIVVDQQDAALTVPRSALATVGSAKGVFLAIDCTARFQPVQVVDWPAARLIVTGGLAEGSALIVDATGLVPGQAIKVGQP